MASYDRRLKTGLFNYVIPEFQSQCKVPLQDDVRPAAIVPSEVVALGEIGLRTESVRAKSESGERLQVRPSQEIANVIERNDIDAIER